MTLQVIYITVLTGFLVLILRSALSTYEKFRKNIAQVNHIPGYRLLIHPNFLISAVLPRWSRHINIGEQYTWRYRHSLFSALKCDLITIVSILPQIKTIMVADPDAIKYIVAERKKFVKPLLMYGPLAMYGPNVGVSEGSEYQRHKKIVASSNLLENINELAWEHSMKTLDACFEEWEEKMEASGRREVKVDSVVSLTLKMALFVILGAAFSHSPPWNDNSADSRPGKHKMSFKEAMHSVLENVWYKIALPQLAYKLPWFKHPKHVDLSYREFTEYMCEMIDRRRVEGANETAACGGKQDLLGAFVKASAADSRADEVDKKRAKLTNQEVCSNIYVFLLAGHDTTAHTLAFTFGLLALYPEVQNRLYLTILETLPTLSDELHYKDVSALEYTLAVFLETLRLYPSVVIVPKYSVEDTLVPVRAFSNDGKTTHETAQTVHIPAHSQVFIDVPALHYNPRYWGPDVQTFRPSRFIDNEKTGYKWPREAFMAFSQGARQCLGQKFAQVEAVTLLAEMVRRFEVSLDPSVLREGESVEDARKRLLDSCKTVITLTPKPLPVIFKERSRK